MKRFLIIFIVLALSFAISMASASTLERTEATLNALTANDDLALRTLAGENAMELAQHWAERIEETGALLSIEKRIEQNGISSLYLNCERAKVLFSTRDGADGLLEAIDCIVVEADAISDDEPLPDDAQEREVVLFPGTERELNGKLVIPSQSDAPYVVFLHGSGRSDMDETVGPNKPFRDLAYQLAARGIGSIRFDKYTYAHPELPCETMIPEYLDPALEALRVVREQTGAQEVYVLGHSQGGLAVPWVVYESGENGFRGGISLAGTPRRVWEVPYQQSMALVEAMPDSAEKTAIIEMLEYDYAIAETIVHLTEEEARATTVFGASGYYVKFSDSLNTIDLAKQSGKPLLILWGEADFQVLRVDFDAWREGLGVSELYTYISYPNLNHLFAPAQEGDGLSLANEIYGRNTPIDPRVSQDIANWIAGQ